VTQPADVEYCHKGAMHQRGAQQHACRHACVDAAGASSLTWNCSLLSGRSSTDASYLLARQLCARMSSMSGPVSTALRVRRSTHRNRSIRCQLPSIASLNPQHMFRSGTLAALGCFQRYHFGSGKYHFAEITRKRPCNCQTDSLHVLEHYSNKFIARAQPFPAPQRSSMCARRRGCQRTATSAGHDCSRNAAGYTKFTYAICQV
jgi:hypothetical protein